MRHLSMPARAAGAAGTAAVLLAGLAACSPDDSGDTYTWWDPYPQHDDASPWAQRADACGEAAGVTIDRTAYDTSALTNQALLSAQSGEVPAPRFTWPDRRIDAVRGCVAVERGPLVLCAAAVDLPAGVSLDDVIVDPAAPPAVRGGRVLVSGRHAVGPDPVGWPYASADGAAGTAGPVGRPVGGPGGGPGGGPAGPAAGGAMDVPLGPYHRWTERGPTAMRVWLPVQG